MSQYPLPSAISAAWITIGLIALVVLAFGLFGPFELAWRTFIVPASDDSPLAPDRVLEPAQRSFLREVESVGARHATDDLATVAQRGRAAPSGADVRRSRILGNVKGPRLTFP